jgi:kinesin family protein C2/C3
VFDPVDVAAEMEVTARVRKAAAEALMEAQDKLRAAEEAQSAMQAQLEQAKELQNVSDPGSNP